MIGLVITVFNRPEYTRRCLDSLSQADLTNCTICIVDDGSRCKETKSLIDNCELPAKTIKIRSRRNLGVSASLMTGFDTLKDCDILTNLDNDAIIKPNFLSVLTNLLERFPDRIITGFNTDTINERGEVRHKIISDLKDHREKSSCGGLNTMFTKDTYLKWVRPELFSSRKGGNWDTNVTRAMAAVGLHVIAAKPSVIQHIGTESTFKGRINPDVSLDFSL